MARRRSAAKRETIPDAKYESTLVTRLITSLMLSGKRATAEKIVYGAIDSINEGNKDSNPLDILKRAI